jgi:dynein heavy chain
MGELYGEENQNNDWFDGLASHYMRLGTQVQPERQYWITFDGPVDAIWVENLNSVLDDSRMLCLSNGQRIRLNRQMRILFEVDSLEQASPATVSRCGMVYLSDEVLTWQ